MRISMITSSRNGMPYLRQCLESMLAASRGLDVEILYEDCCSTDGSAECARQLIGPEHVNVEPDDGFGDAVNRAFRKCTGDIVGALPADDLMAEEGLRHVVTAFTAHPEARWAIGMYEIIDAEGRPTRLFHNAYKNFAVRHFHRYWLMAENIIPAVSFFIRRDFRQQIGDLLHESTCLANDYDYFIRCVKQSPPLVIPHVLGRWRYHAHSQTGRNLKRMSWDAWQVCRQHTRNPLFLAANAVCSLRNALVFDKLG